MKILCYVSPWSAEQYQAISKGIDKNSVVILMSAYKSLDQSGVVTSYYDFLNQSNIEVELISEEDLDIIKRCRILRAIPKHKAQKHIVSLRNSINIAFNRHQPTLILSETVDSFFMDVLYGESIKRGIKFVGLVPSFVNGYYRVTAKGEYNCLRTPSDEEIAQVLSMLENKEYSPQFLNNSKNALHVAIIKRWAKNLIKPVYFTLKRWLSGEKYNLHYWGSQIVTWQWLHLLPNLTLGNPEWKQNIKLQTKPIIYIPLQFVPEATIDYWCEDLSLIDYEPVLIRLIKRLLPDFHIVIKEHPNVLGLRHPSFYKKINKIDGITICPTSVNSNELIELCDSVLVWTGSVGFEAALRGKPVFTLSSVYYANGDRFKIIGNDTTNLEMLQFIKNASRPLEQREKIQMITYLLSGLLKGKLKNDWSWTAECKQDTDNACLVGHKLVNI